MANEKKAVQWGMNNTLAHIGIQFEEDRERAIQIGEEIGALKDFPTSPSCTSTSAPIWITEMVARKSS